MKFLICKLRFKGALHLGEREGWSEGSGTHIHSDTLFSAFCSGYLLLYGERRLKESLLEGFVSGNPPFLISSTFPFWRGEYFFPVPKNQIPRGKEAKKVVFAAKPGFEAMLKGSDLEETMLSYPVIPAAVSEEDQPRYPWSAQDVPRVALSRLDNQPGEAFFHVGEVT